MAFASVCTVLRILTGKEGHAPPWPELRQSGKVVRNGLYENLGESRKDREGLLQAPAAASSLRDACPVYAFISLFLHF